jgi:hypothetical protein
VGWDRDHPYIEVFKRAGYIVEENIRSEEKSELLVLFPIEETQSYRYTEDETNIWEQFQSAVEMQYWWSDNGVSCTVKFDPKTEANQIADCLSKYEDRLKAISLLPKTGHGFKQAPYTMVSDAYSEEERHEDGHRLIWTNEEFETYRKKINSKLLRKEIAKLAVDAEGDKYCTTDTCELKSLEIAHVNEI